MSLLSEQLRSPPSSATGFATPTKSHAEFMSEIIGATCRRFPSIGQSDKTARLERLIQSQAWTDAALALIDLELPQWQVRRLAYDEGEWHCALSRQRELPDWLDQSIETRHADLALAILGAFVEARRISAPASRTSVPPVPRRPIPCMNRSAATISREPVDPCGPCLPLQICDRDISGDQDFEHDHAHPDGQNSSPINRQPGR